MTNEKPEAGASDDPGCRRRNWTTASIDASQSHIVVGMGLMVFRLHECHSLKAKRKISKAIISQIRNHFNASVAEVGANELHQRLEIGFALIGNETATVNAKIDKVFNLADALGLAEVIDSQMEILHI